MAFSTEQTGDIVKRFRLSELDTGSSEVQIALLTYKIRYLTEHFKKHDKDHHGRRGLLTMVNRRKRLLVYLKDTDFDRYQKIIGELGIRK